MMDVPKATTFDQGLGELPASDVVHFAIGPNGNHGTALDFTLLRTVPGPAAWLNLSLLAAMGIGLGWQRKRNQSATTSH